MDENPFGSAPGTDAAQSNIENVFEMMAEGMDGIDPSDHLHPSLLGSDVEVGYAATIGIQISASGNVLLYLGSEAFQFPPSALPDVINELIAAAYESRSALADELQLSVADLPQVYEWSEDLLIGRYRGELRGGEYQFPAVFLDDDEYSKETQAELVRVIESFFESVVSFDAMAREPDIISVHTNDNVHAVRTSDAFVMAADLALLQCGLSQTNCTHLDPVVPLDTFPDDMRTALETEYDDLATNLDMISFETDGREYVQENPHNRMTPETGSENGDTSDTDDEDGSVDIDIDFES